MRIAYYLLTTIFYYLLRPYLYLRILKKKECPTRYQEKLGKSLRTRKNGKLIWFHCSSIGELKSIFPIIDNYLKKNQILVTTSTLSSLSFLGCHMQLHSELFLHVWRYLKSRLQNCGCGWVGPCLELQRTFLMS